MIDSLYESYKREKDIDSFDELPEEILELLLESKEDIKKGKFFTHEEVMAEAKKRFDISK